MKTMEITHSHEMNINEEITHYITIAYQNHDVVDLDDDEFQSFMNFTMEIEDTLGMKADCFREWNSGVAVFNFRDNFEKVYKKLTKAKMKKYINSDDILIDRQSVKIIEIERI